MNEHINTNKKKSKLPLGKSVSLLTQIKYGYIEMAEHNKQIAEEMDHLESEALYTTEKFLKEANW